MMKRLTALTLIASFCAPALALALDSKGAAYFGGTAAFSTATEPVDGTLDTKDGTALVFHATAKGYQGQSLAIPYADILDLEYGQKAGRRVGAAIGSTILLGPIGLLMMFSKKRKHFLTVGFKDASGTDQVAVLELGKDIVRATLPIVETRSGKKILYQDDEAKKSS